MLRKIIKIDQEKCNGCGLCATACHENAISMVNGKACLMREDFCDGMGDCLPACPLGAISFEEREAASYNEAAAKAHIQARQSGITHNTSFGCQGSRPRSLKTERGNAATCSENAASELAQWPVQIRLSPSNHECFQESDLLIAADCTAFAYKHFHDDFMHDHVTLIGCPKLDPVDYSEKLYEILHQNSVKSITVARMQVPCCKGLEMAVKRAIAMAEMDIPLNTIVISTSGKVVEEMYL